MPESSTVATLVFHGSRALSKYVGAEQYCVDLDLRALCIFFEKVMADATRGGRKAPFGSPLGVAPGGVVAYSSHYASADAKQYPDRGSFHAYHESGVWTGHKYQCVEFARRWLVHTHGITFGSIGMAYTIFDLPAFAKATDPREGVPVRKAENGNPRHHRPVRGTVLLWHPTGFFSRTGHVAIVTEATDRYVRVAEQNVTDRPWNEGCDFARELPVVMTAEGGFHVVETYARSAVLGWVTPEVFLAQKVAKHSHSQATLMPSRRVLVEGVDF